MDDTPADATTELCVHCGKDALAHDDRLDLFEPPRSSVVMAPWAERWEDIEEALSVLVPINSRGPRWRRVLTDTLQWRFIALTTDFIVLTVATGEPLIAGTAAIGLFVIKTVLFILWRAWRETKF